MRQNVAFLGRKFQSFPGRGRPPPSTPLASRPRCLLYISSCPPPTESQICPCFPVMVKTTATHALSPGILFGLTPLMMQTASTTSLTPSGGRCIARTSVTSFLLRDLRLASAASYSQTEQQLYVRNQSPQSSNSKCC